jgi:hypothetical protein
MVFVYLLIEERPSQVLIIMGECDIFGLKGIILERREGKGITHH